MPLHKAEMNLIKKLQQAQIDHASPPLADLSISEYREALDFLSDLSGDASDAPYDDLSIKVRDGSEIQVRIFHPQLEKAPVVFFYPGCGYICDLFESNAIIASRIAHYAGVKVIIPNYRFAPEFPIPTSILDSFDITLHIINNASFFKINPDKIILSGLSSGANCSAVITSQLCKNQFTIQHQILYNGFFDFTGNNQINDEKSNQDALLNEEGLDYIINTIKTDFPNLADPILSPYYFNDSQFIPPTTFLIAEYDRLFWDSIAYFDKLKAEGIKVDKIILPGQIHSSGCMRGVLTDGEDPAMTFAKVVKKIL